jgi:hypothetical protein
MKFLRLSVVGLLLAFAFACDKVTDPIVPAPPAPADTNTYTRNMLFEDYTGQDCPNCPAGTVVLEDLLNTYSNLIPVAIHAGDFAVPNAKFTSDYRTSAGSFWLKHYKIGYWPSGMVNRKKYSGSNVHSNSSNWRAAVSKASEDPYVLGLEPVVAFNAASRIITSSVKVKFKDAYNDSIRVSALITEEGVTGKQNSAGLTVEDYEFNHLFRGTISDQSYWGEKVPGKNFAALAEVSVSFPTHTLDPKIKAENCYIIVFAFNELTKEILQAERIKLTVN